MFIVKAKVPVMYKGIRYKAGKELKIKKQDMNNEYFLFIREKKANLTDMTVGELRRLAKKKGLEGYSDMKKAELIDLLEGD